MRDRPMHFRHICTVEDTEIAFTYLEIGMPGCCAIWLPYELEFLWDVRKDNRLKKDKNLRLEIYKEIERQLINEAKRDDNSHIIMTEVVWNRRNSPLVPTLNAYEMCWKLDWYVGEPARNPKTGNYVCTFEKTIARKRKHYYE